MKHFRWIFVISALFTGIVAAYAGDSPMQQKGGTDDFGPYEPVPNWFKPLRPGYLERGLSVFVDTPNRIFFTSDLEFVPRRGSGVIGAIAPGQASPDHHFVMILDANGNVVDEWKQWESLIQVPHAIKISPYDPERNVWIVDRVGEQILKFSHDGKKLLMTLGEKGVMGTDHNHFGQPANISFTPDGSFYIADGYVNTRIVKFDKNGKFLLQWGSAGGGPGQFKVLVHDVAVDPERPRVRSRSRQPPHPDLRPQRQIPRRVGQYHPTELHPHHERRVRLGGLRRGQPDRPIRHERTPADLLGPVRHGSRRFR